MKEYGDESWELDALDPKTLSDLILNAVLPLRDEEIYEQDRMRESATQDRLKELANRWDSVEDWLDGNDPENVRLLEALAKVRIETKPQKYTIKQLEAKGISERHSEALENIHRIADEAINHVDD